MDEFLYLLGAVMAVLVLVVIMYMGSVYMMRERSFESAIAAQTANRKELLESASGKQDKKVKRQQVQRKSLEKPLISDVNKSSPTSALQHRHSPSSKKRVALELEPEIIEVDDFSTEESKSVIPRPISPSKVAKPILLNKDEKGEISLAVSVPELFHRHPSVDELELQLKERRKSEETLHAHSVEHEVVAVAAVTSQADVVIKAKKKKPKGSAAIEDNLETELKVSGENIGKSKTEKKPVQQSSLNNDANSGEASSTSGEDSKLAKEVRDLQQSILNVKKQLSEKEQALKKEQERLASSNAKINQLQEELAGEKQKSIEVQNQKVASASQELKVLREKLHMLQTQFVEISQSNKQLMNENMRLKESTQMQLEVTQKLSKMEDAMQKSSMALASNENSKRHLEAKLHQYEDQIAQLNSLLKEAKSENQDLVTQVNQVERLREQLNVKQNADVHRMQQLETSVKEYEVDKMKLEQHVMTLEHQLAEMDKKLKTVPAGHIGEVAVATERNDTQSKLAAKSSTNFNCNGTGSDSAGTSDELARLQQTLNEQKLRNDELREKNYAVLSALNVMEKKAEELFRVKEDCERKGIELTRLNSQLKELKAKQQLQQTSNKTEVVGSKTCKQAVHSQPNCTGASLSALPSTSSDINGHGSVEISKLQNLLTEQRCRNEELRQKNYTLLDALSRMEKLAENSVRLKDELACKDSEVKQLKSQLKQHTAQQTQHSDKSAVVSANADTQLKSECEKLNCELKSLHQHKNQLEKNVHSLQETCAVTVEEKKTSVGQHGQACHVTAEAADRRKPVAVVTHIQETASWDMLQLVLELDTKNAELHILQSLLEQNQSAVHGLEKERADLRKEVKDLHEKLAQKEQELQTLAVASKACDEDEKSEDVVKLQSLVQHYKTVLHDTENMLSSLEASVLKEENSWKAELDKERVRSRQYEEQLSALLNK